MTQPHSDDTSFTPTQPHSNTGGEQPYDDGLSVKVGDLLFRGRYRVVEIRHGGMGFVYKCEDLVTHFTVALKTVQTVGGMSEDDVKNMVRSFKLIFGLVHPHIIRVNYLDKDEKLGNWFVVMDWVDGEDLETRLKKEPRGVLSKEETIRTLEQVASALDYAHEKGVVHRDVKCANIMMKPDGEVLLIDFGIAGHASATARATATNATGGLTTTINPYTGTQGYQPPEQWCGEKTCAASDQYSLAVTAYRCLSGHLPFEHPNRGELREMVMYDDLPRIRAISDAANAVLKKALAKRTEDRYGSCAEFIRELAKRLGTVEINAESLRSRGAEFVNAESQRRGVAEVVNAEPQERGAAKVVNRINLPQGDMTLDLNGVPLKLKWIVAGTFMMGSKESEQGRKDDETLHKVTLTKDFWLGETEVTQAQYEVVMGENPSEFKKGGDYPVEQVSWDDAMEFCRKVTEIERKAGRLLSGYEYTLPTEAQWEYAARGGSKSRGYKYSGGDNLDEVGWYLGNSEPSMHPVGRKKPNELGLYDMSCNVWEWCRDNCKWDNGVTTDTYKDGVVDPWCRNGSLRVFRGGSWIDTAALCRSAFRGSIAPSCRDNGLGFRVALVPVQ